jgi:hypothetical protein
MAKPRSPKLIELLRAVLESTALAFTVLLFYPWLRSAWEAFSRYTLNLITPGHIWILAVISVVCGLTISAFLVFSRIVKSFRQGLISVTHQVWVVALTICWILFARRHYLIALFPVLAAEMLTVFFGLIQRAGPSVKKIDDSMDPDLALPENGTDLLNRGEIINRLVSIILREQPSVIGLTGAYGDGKTSLLNLTVGKLKTLEREQSPVIVKFSPWLPADSNALVTSLLTSIVAEIRKEYAISGLKQGIRLYARALLGIVPKGKVLEEFVKEPAQHERTHSLAQQIAKMPRRIVVILDDLDRMQAKELETVFKILRGSENLSSVTFICSFDHKELSSILRSTRRFQNTSKFIEKFFQVTIGLPRVDSSQIKDIFAEQISNAVSKFLEDSRQKEFPQFVDQLWKSGGERHFTNLRTLKLYANKIRYSLPIVGAEINVEDFLELELVR